MSPTDCVCIREAAAEDASGILKCLAAAFEPYRSRYTPEAYADTVLTDESLGVRLATMRIFVALGTEDQIIGTIACAPVSPEEGHLRGMAVLPEWLGRGIAEGLLSRAEADLAKNGCFRITLDTTEPLERAMRFYEKQGYYRSGRITDFFGMVLHEYVKEIAPAQK